MNFEIFDHWKTKVAANNGVELFKVYFGFINECFNQADRYCVKTGNLSGDMQAVLMNAVHFIDLTWFEMNYKFGACGGV